MDIGCPTWPARAVLHVDMDAFFAAVEQLDHPDWRGLPVIVGGAADRRGVVAAASYEARRSGVRSAMPSAQAQRLCPDAVWAPARFERYRELSRRILALFEELTPAVEQISIDEAFLDVTPSAHRPVDPVDVATGIQRRVDGLGLSCSVGVATCKTVAKIASDHDKPHGITIVRPGEESAFLAPLPVDALPGIGSATAAALRAAGIRTLGDLAVLDPASATELMGSAGPVSVQRAAGIDDRPVAPSRDVKSVSNEHTFSSDVRERDEVEAALRRLVDKVSVRLREKGLQGRTVTVKLRYADFTTKTVRQTLPAAMDLTDELLPPALELIRDVWTPGAGLRLLGFGVSGFGVPSTQLDLFADEGTYTSKSRALVESMDAVRARFGDDAIMRGAPHVEADERKA